MRLVTSRYGDPAARVTRVSKLRYRQACWARSVHQSGPWASQSIFALDAPLSKKAGGLGRVDRLLGSIEVVVADRAPCEIMEVLDAIERRHPVALRAGIFAKAHVVALRGQQVAPRLVERCRLRNVAVRGGDRVEQLRRQEQPIDLAV